MSSQAPVSANAPSILCVFPSFEEYGGIQVSARLAWQCVAGDFPGRADVFCFGRATPADFAGARRAVTAGGKAGAVLAAARRQWAVDAILVWHAGLTRLVPAFEWRRPRGLPPARVIAFLHGIETDAIQDNGGLSHVNLFLHNSEATWKRFVARYPTIAATAEHELVPLGIGEPTTPAVANDQTCAAVIVGRLEARESYKGHRELIEVWPLVRQKVPAAELWVIGDGSLRPAMERLAESVCPGAVTFLGFLSEADKEQRLRRARCLVMPSRGEGFGLVYIEAMRVGTPCLVGTQDAGCEVVAPPEAGIAVDAGARGELVAGVVRLLTPGDEWDRWSAQARRRYESNFTARHFKQRLLDCLHI